MVLAWMCCSALAGAQELTPIFDGDDGISDPPLRLIDIFGRPSGGGNVHQ